MALLDLRDLLSDDEKLILLVVLKKSSPASRSLVNFIIAFDKERAHNAVEIDIFGLCIHRHQFAPPPPEKLFRGE